MKLNAKVKGKINLKNNAMIKQIAIQSLVDTADVVKRDLQRSQTMPYDTGELQNRSTFVDDSKKDSGKVSIVSDTPYARRMYMHPEYKFYKGHNKNAGGEWFEPYINGNKKDFAKKKFAKIMKGKLK
jgi:hypothetical protein